jgi:hypothetical protein
VWDYGDQKRIVKQLKLFRTFHRTPCGCVREPIIWEWFKLENLELFDPTAKEYYWDEFLQQCTHTTKENRNLIELSTKRNGSRRAWTGNSAVALRLKMLAWTLHFVSKNSAGEKPIEQRMDSGRRALSPMETASRLPEDTGNTSPGKVLPGDAQNRARQAKVKRLEATCWWRARDDSHGNENGSGSTGMEKQQLENPADEKIEAPLSKDSGRQIQNLAEATENFRVTNARQTEGWNDWEKTKKGRPEHLSEIQRDWAK